MNYRASFLRRFCYRVLGSSLILLVSCGNSRANELDQGFYKREGFDSKSLDYNDDRFSFRDLQTGDVLLLELHCYSCQMIRKTSKSIYSHSGLVVISPQEISLQEPDKNRLYAVEVLQSIAKAEKLSLKDFLNQAKQSSYVKVLRPRELMEYPQKLKSQRAGSSGTSSDEEISLDTRGDAYRTSTEQRAKTILTMFFSAFNHSQFDSQYLWDNRDLEGKEIVYCSELVQKLLNRVLKEQLEPQPMDYLDYWDFWDTYFQGKVPQGLPGNSPGTLERSRLMVPMYEGKLDALIEF